MPPLGLQPLPLVQYFVQAIEELGAASVGVRVIVWLPDCQLAL